MRRWRLWLAGSIVTAMCGCGAAILFPVFASARAAEEITRQLTNGKRLSTAIMEYAAAHKDRLPGNDWRVQVERYDPGILSEIERAESDGIVGYAALPHVLGKSLREFDSGTIIFVQYHAPDRRSVIHNPVEVGVKYHGWTALIVFSGEVRRYNRNEVLKRLNEQGAFASAKH